EDGDIEVCSGGFFQVLGACPSGTTCRDGECITEEQCEPACDGRECGGDGCGGYCGACEVGEVCNTSGQCVATPENCGDGTCDADEDCATCPDDCGTCCGDGTCDPAQNEDCWTCPADCGSCCGDGACNPSHDETCLSCPADCGCPAGSTCDPETETCVCAPDCDGRECGDDGCEGSCGSCDEGYTCSDSGLCVEEGCQPDCEGRECGDDGCGSTCGSCDEGYTCNASGQCVEESCQPDCTDRECGDDGCEGSCGSCDEGYTCNAAGQCVSSSSGCECTGDQVCVDGRCRDPEVLCSETNPTGICESGYTCVEGSCVSDGAGCSSSNPAGVCPMGEWCDGGTCVPYDDEVLCDDENPCTFDWYDGARNRCVHEADDTASCTDGNGCTTNWCEGGVCMAEQIQGCIEPPVIDPYVTPTNEGSLTLSGTKPAGSSIEINGATAVSENPEETWSVSLDLAPGDNVYTVRSREGTTASETVEVEIVYDITSPTTVVTPGGGVFRTGVTVQVSTDEPATVYYTTDGSTPDEWSPSFQSLRTFRIYDTTTLRLLARDTAGNWEEEVVSAHFEITSAAGEWSAGSTLPSSLINAGAARLGTSIHVVGGSSGQAPQAGGHSYDYLTDTWSSLPSLPDGRAQLALVALDDYIYAIGGEKEGSPRNDVTRLQPGVDTEWTARQSMPTTRYGLAAIPYAGKIHVLGGKASGGTVLATHEVYDPSTDSWTNSPPDMPRPRYAFGAVLHEHKIYVVGGEDGAGNPIAELDIYDLQNETWSQGPDLPTPRSFAAVGLMRNVGEVTGGNCGIVVAGGRSAGGSTTAVVEEYVVEEDAWRERTPLDAGRHSGATVRVSAPYHVDTLRNEIWIVGGQDAAGPTGEIVRFSKNQDYVRHLPDLPDGRMMHAAAALDGIIYVLGGKNHTEELGGWAFDPETGSYTDLPELSSAQEGLALVALSGQVYAIGGEDEYGNAVAHVRAFDPVAWSWIEKQPMLTARRDAAVTVVGGEIYVIGGENNGALQTVEIYDPVENSWRSGPTLPEGRKGAMAITHEGDVWVFG
ncbi:MAG: Kelch repeat-containing protein, partial [Myxococcota bacterium]